MFDSRPPGFAEQLRRRATKAALAVLAVAVVVGCDNRAGIVGTAGGISAPIPDATLRALTVSAGTLVPLFDSSRVSYALSVPAVTDLMTVIPIATAPASIVTVNGAIVPSGSTSPDIPLGIGSTLIIIRVTAPDTITFRTYTITVLRPPLVVVPGKAPFDSTPRA